MKVEKTGYTNEFRFDFVSGGALFLCKSGLAQHWDISGAKTITCRLSDRPSVDSHKFTTRKNKYGSYNITIEPDVGEDWDAIRHDTYQVFSKQLGQYAERQAIAHGYMSLIIEERDAA